jgi:membrane protease YdiL (CAAX protease family)
MARADDTDQRRDDPAEGGYLRFYYRNRRPTRFGRLSNQVWAWATGLGLTPSPLLTLQVKDRRNGRLRSTVLVPAQYEGERYFASMLGDGSEWVQNVRAACGQAFIKRGRADPVMLAEIPPKDRAPILKAWCQVATSGRKHLPVPYDAPESAFEAIAADYPIFRIDSAIHVESTPQALGREQADHSAHPLHFLGWALLLSIPFYVWGVFWPIDGLLPFGLPISATMIIVPALVATVMTGREQKRRAAIELWRRIFDAGRAKRAWALVAFLFMPVAMFISYDLMHWLGLALPAEVAVTVAQASVLFAAFFLGAILEEIGWTGYATEPLQARYGVLRAGLIIGGVWAAWHIVPWWLHSQQVIWVAAHGIGVVISRIVMGWIYAYGGRSLFLAITFHAMGNVGYFSFPNNGSHYNPSLTTLVLAGMAILMAIPIIKSRRGAITKAL